MAICRERAAPMLEAERRWFGAQASTRSLAGFFGELTAVVANMPENSCLLQIGWGGGWHNKTVGAALTDRQREDLIGRYRLARGRRERGDPFPKSRRVVVNAQGRPAAPLGWVLIEMKPEDNA